MKSLSSKNITIGGILVALTVLILYLTPLIPINTLALLTISSCFVPIAIIRGNMKTGIFVYIASSLIGLFLVQINIIVFYILFFGIYGIIKFYIEKLNNIIFEIILKLLFSDIFLIIIYFIMLTFLGGITLKLPILVLVIAAQFIILIYDYALTLLISFYLDKLHNK